MGLHRVDYREGNVKQQISSVVRSCLRNYRCSSYEEFRTLLEAFNVLVEERTGTINGRNYAGIVYGAMTDDGYGISTPFKSSRIGRDVGYKALQKYYENSKIKLKEDGTLDRLRQTVRDAMSPHNTRDEFWQLLKTDNIDAVFRVEPPMSAVEQKNVFDTALADTLEKDCSYDVVQSVHEQLRGRIQEHKENRDPAPLELTVGDVGGILSESGVSEEKVESFRRECEKQYGENAALNPKNILGTGKFEITTPEVKITVAPENSYLIEARMIGGRRYLLIPADDGVEVNGVSVSIPNEEHS